MKKFINKIKQLFCRHKNADTYYIACERAKVKYKKTKRGYKYRYDIFQKRYCFNCNKLLKEVKVKSDLTEFQVWERFKIRKFKNE